MSDSQDLSSLPAPNVVEALDFESINAAHRADLIARHPSAAAVLDLESEPLTKLVESNAYRELLVRDRVNTAARAYLLAYANGADLDHKGDFYGLPRLIGEGDERYRVRIKLRIKSLAGNGTREAYEVAAMTVSLDVRAARATQPTPGSVLVLVWVEQGADAAATLEAVRVALTRESALILGVNLLVQLARPRLINVRARIFRNASAPSNIVQQIAEAFPGLIEKHAALGQDLSRAWISARLVVDGVVHVDYPSADEPSELTALALDEYASPGNIELIDAGVLG